VRKSPEPLSPGSVQPVLGDLDIWKSLRLDSCENNDRHLNRKYRRKVDKVTMFMRPECNERSYDSACDNERSNQYCKQRTRWMPSETEYEMLATTATLEATKTNHAT
jgi:hypothetical protein